VPFESKSPGQCLRIADDLLAIGKELVREYLVEGNSLGRYHMLQRTALCAGENREVQQLAHQADIALRSCKSPWVFEIGLHQYNTAAWTAKCLMCSRGNDLAMLK